MEMVTAESGDGEVGGRLQELGDNGEVLGDGSTAEVVEGRGTAVEVTEGQNGAVGRRQGSRWLTEWWWLGFMVAGRMVAAGVQGGRRSGGGGGRNRPVRWGEAPVEVHTGGWVPTTAIK